MNSGWPVGHCVVTCQDLRGESNNHRLPKVDPQLSESLTRWTVRVAIVCYLWRVWLDLGANGVDQARSSRRTARWSWTIGCVFNILHVVCAFEFVHQWSHASAYRHTAEQTAALIGIHWGGGLYFNYAFTLFWLWDTIAWWLRGVDFPYIAHGYFWSVHAIFAFMLLNATVVFGPSGWRMTGIAVAAALCARYLYGQRHH